MESFPNFYTSLKALLEEIPDGRKTTTNRLALAMGDIVAESAIEQTLNKKEFSQYIHKVEQKSKTRKLNFFFKFPRREIIRKPG